MLLYPILAILFFFLLRPKPHDICYPGCGPYVRNPSNIGLTLNASIGAILAPLYTDAPTLLNTARIVTIAL